MQHGCHRVRLCLNAVNPFPEFVDFPIDIIHGDLSVPSQTMWLNHRCVPDCRAATVRVLTYVKKDRNAIAIMEGRLERSPVAQEALGRIAALYAIEREIRGRKPALRRSVRMARALPLASELKDWLEHTLAQVSTKSNLGRATRYALGNWPALVRYCEDGRIEVDNNTAERAIRPLVIGRRNYLFAGSDGGGQSAAVIYSLIGTARLNGVEPYAYLRTVFERIADHPINQIDELLPWRLMPAEQPLQQVA